MRRDYPPRAGAIMSDLMPSLERRRAVLVVEDEAPICDMLSDMLEDAGYEVRCTQSDSAARQALRHRGVYACLIVDVNLGRGTTGYDVARHARLADPGVPVIYVSGQTSQESFAANSVRGSLFVEKPFTRDTLLASVEMLVGQNDD